LAKWEGAEMAVSLLLRIAVELELKHHAAHKRDELDSTTHILRQLDDSADCAEIVRSRNEKSR
jgi:hypothetical protein